MSNFRKFLESKLVEGSAPCRIDMGGTLDISTFYYPLRHLCPSTFNIALDLRTQVQLLPYRKDRIKISSKGFESAEFDLDHAQFNHPLGLMFAIAAYFRADGIHIHIESSSPPRSALGGSSVAAAALIGAFSKALEEMGEKAVPLKNIAPLAHAIEESVAGVPCGLQDQLAAVYGGVNAWIWLADTEGPGVEQKIVVDPENFKNLEKHLLVAYCGIPHESKNINSRWVQQFISGQSRDLWAKIIQCTQNFIDALGQMNFQEASKWMNRETDIRRNMTPDVLDEMGESLVQSALELGCGARFTGAGGGGCIWALGGSENIHKLKEIWTNRLKQRKDGRLLEVHIASQGLQTS